MSLGTFNKIPPHGVVRNWLGAEAVERLLSYAKSNEHLFKESGIGYATSGRIDITRRTSKRLNDLDNFTNEMKANVQNLLPKIFETLGNKPFMPTFELELVAHGDGAFFARHFDTTVTHQERLASDRIISAVYYFHAQPKAFSGGVLRLHSLAASGDQGTYVDIPPNYDSLVFFPSMFPHEVLPVKVPSGKFLDSRFAINCWIRRTSRNTGG
jgi:SM-20-related protein